MSIIRITKELTEKANKAREAALLKDADYRLHEERVRLMRQAAAQQQKEQVLQVSNAARRAAPSNDPGCPPCEQHQRVERKGDGAREDS